MVSVSDRDDGTPKDTVRNILATGEFVVNLVSEELFEKMLYNLSRSSRPR
ncbi:MAG: hypothetical protein Q9N34_04610 [Aquificota bacterium]|nr:hypothetical protein [Aquificota bacterium]